LFEGKVLLITGGTGSFDNQVLNRFLSTDVAEMQIFSRDEKKQEELRRKLDNEKFKFYIGYVPADNRDLNYSKYFNSGEEKISGIDDYTSYNSKYLDVPQINELLLKLDYIRHELEQWPARHRQPATNRVPASR
jgi:FlaA1/EpsC-like NDP-sugar epimerase